MWRGAAADTRGPKKNAISFANGAPARYGPAAIGAMSYVLVSA
jgi:hypothetical protein